MPRYLCRWYSNLVIVLLWYQKSLVIWDKVKRYMYKNPTGSGRTGWSSGFFLEVAELPIKAILPSNLMRKVGETKNPYLPHSLPRQQAAELHGPGRLRSLPPNPQKEPTQWLYELNGTVCLRTNWVSILYHIWWSCRDGSCFTQSGKQQIKAGMKSLTQSLEHTRPLRTRKRHHCKRP